MDSPGANIPEYSVAELSGAVKRALEGAFGRVRVRGEITECKAYGPGRFYFSLKDTDPDSKSKLNAVIWSHSARTGLRPENGTEVIATGRLTAYGDRSSYQLTVERLEYAGAGAMLARIEALKAKLLAEGLFAEPRKRKLPSLPGLVAVVTSAQGAVLHDIRTTIARRFARRIQLWPVPVQGEGAAERIAEALSRIASLPVAGPVPRPDVVILARGGGSLEDLMAFNDEAVVRAVAAMPCPIVTAIGHETDTTLVDFAADLRAPTPTAAAELVVPSRAALVAEVESRGARLVQATLALRRQAELRLERASGRLPDLPALLLTLTQRLDGWSDRLRGALPACVAAKRLRLSRAQPRDPRARLAEARGKLALLASRARAGIERALQARRSAAALARLSPAPVLALVRERRARLAGLAAEMEALSHRRVLLRGFAMVEGAEGAPVAAAAQVAPGDRLVLRFHDGAVPARAEAAASEASRPSAAPERPAPTPARARSRQGAAEGRRPGSPQAGAEASDPSPAPPLEGGRTSSVGDLRVRGGVEAAPPETAPKHAPRARSRPAPSPNRTQGTLL